MPNRSYYVMKFNSSWLREFNFNVNISFQDALQTKKIIALADNQMLRLVRDITNRKVDMDNIENLFYQRDRIKRMANNKENISKLKYIQKQIYNSLFIPEYIVISIESNKDYDYMFKGNLYINGKRYVRTSCSASQGRVSKVVFCEENVSKKLLNTLDNGRDKTVPFSPSKYNAYLGTASSATKIVSTPRFCVIPDCFYTKNVDTWWVTEVTNKDDDDIIEQKTIEMEFNLFDGNGLISPTKAQEWADELGIDYLPAQWCIRAPWVKGMVNVFDFHQFCKEINGGNYLIDTIYKDKNGKPIKADLREIDVILTEGQFKLWSSYNSLDSYIENCNKNKLYWGVSIYTPKYDKDILNLNYQFIQTLDLDKEKVEKLCSQTVDYFNGVSLENYWYTLLFLMGVSLNNEKITNFINNTNSYWLKSLVINQELIKDKYIREKIHDNIKTKMDNACMGRILVDGNFQVIVPDSYAFMEHACGLEVKGLLNEGEYYSRYWVNRNVTKVDTMRSPLTYLSEHFVVDIKHNEKIDKWYKYSYTGFITNVWGEHTLRWAGSDYDYDIIASTSNEIMVNNTYHTDLPVVYQAPKPNKIVFTNEDLQIADKFTFGSIIGRITNNVTIIRTLMYNFDKDSKEYKTLLNRMRMGCKLQSAQIDKAKIGRAVKGIPTVWGKWNKVTDSDTEEQVNEKNFLNSLICDKHPYFFIYLYSSTKKKYKKWKNDFDISCKSRWNMGVEQLIQLENKTDEQENFIERYYRSCPVVDNNSGMNLLCHYMESVKNNIKINIKNCPDMEYINIYKRADYEYSDDTRYKVYDLIKQLRKELRASISNSNKNKFDSDISNDLGNIYEIYTNKIFKVCSNKYEIINCLIDIFYIDFPSYNKDILWNMFGNDIVENVIHNSGTQIQYPIESIDGDILYLGKKYKVVTCDIGGVE